MPKKNVVKNVVKKEKDEVKMEKNVLTYEAPKKGTGVVNSDNIIKG